MNILFNQTSIAKSIGKLKFIFPSGELFSNPPKVFQLAPEHNRSKSSKDHKINQNQ